MANPVFRYGNGFDIDAASLALKGRLKWMADGTSKSRRYFDDGSFHSIVTDQVLRDIQPDATATTVSIANLKKQLESSAIRRALDLVFPQSTLIDQPSTIYVMVPNHIRVAEAPKKDFCGYEIVAAGIDSVIQINSAVLNFSADTPVHLMLVMEGQSDIIWEQTVQAVAGKHVVAPLTDCYLSYTRTKNSIFYFGYKMSELENGALPYKQDGVQCCSAALWGARSMYCELPALYGQVQYPDVMYGLNLEISGLSDYTDRIVNSPASFDELIGLCMASMILEQYVFSARKNDTTRTTVDKASMQMELTGTAPITDVAYSPGNIRKRMLLEVEKVRSSFTKRYRGVYSLP